MAEEQSGTTDGTDRADARPRRRGTAFAALTGALIGALAGLTGSVLAYVEAGNAHRDDADARRADIRRAAYVELAATTNAYVQQATQLLSVSLDPARSAEDRRRLFEEKYSPANTDLARAVTTVRLVTPPADRRDLERIGDLSTRVGEIATARSAKGPEGADARKEAAAFEQAVREQLDALQAFLDKAADQVI
ncbi:hypothetical protein ACGFXC_04590 [Streptomyces sp. NPDC048507]|uniref:hypothetical protein n=1 Tax=Streptomyces sp. NPDC048507 TaxID=3365560 RepID=UPI0037191B05